MDDQNNYFEWVAGLNPLDSRSLFNFRMDIEPVLQKPCMRFFPLVANRNYTVHKSSTLDPGGFMPLGDSEVSDDGVERTVHDALNTSPSTYYRVEIEMIAP